MVPFKECKIKGFFTSIVLLLIGLILFVEWWRLQLIKVSKHPTNFTLGDSTNRRPNCDQFSFSLHGMYSCVPILNCTSIETEVKKGRLIGNGGVKKVFLAHWNGYKVTWNEMHYRFFMDKSDHFDSTLEKLRKLRRDNNLVTPVLGLCKTLMIKEYYKFGSVKNKDKVFDSLFHDRHELFIRYQMQLCKDYVKILKTLHHDHQNITYVMCDALTLEKLLNQYLLTDDLHLVLNDLDWVLPINKTIGNSISCSSCKLLGNKHIHKDYNEKNEIRKIPDVCEYFLGKDDKTNKQLQDIHLKCKRKDPWKRPTAQQVLEVYEKVKFG